MNAPKSVSRGNKGLIEGAAAEFEARLTAAEAARSFFGTPVADISQIILLADGISNFSFLVPIAGEDYVIRVPGALGGDRSRFEAEYANYSVMMGAGFDGCDEIIYMDPSAMVKITRYIPHARYPDVFDETDIGRCMALLRRIHGLPARAATTFDLGAVFTEAAAKIDFDAGAYLSGYDRMAAEATSLFETLPVGREQSYCHLDPIKYNFLFSDRPGNRDRMIDFEYAGLSDPFLDLATFAVYNGYKPDLSHTMFSLYLGRSPKAEERRALNVFIALEGLYSAIWYLERLVHGAAVSPDKERAFMRASYSSACAHIGLG